jgi:hypothetical protein
VLRLTESILQGTVTASLILRKLGAYPRQNDLAVALREIGRIELTLVMLTWLQDPALRRRVTAGLNKGEARNSLARAVFFWRSARETASSRQRLESPGRRYPLWKTVYLESAVTLLINPRPLRRPCFSMCHRSGGSISASPAIICGASASESRTVTSVLSEFPSSRLAGA